MYSTNLYKLARVLPERLNLRATICRHIFYEVCKCFSIIKHIKAGVFNNQPDWSNGQAPQPIRYGVVVNIAVSHTAAGGSIPPIGITFSFFFFNCLYMCFIWFVFVLLSVFYFWGFTLLKPLSWRCYYAEIGTSPRPGFGHVLGSMPGLQPAPFLPLNRVHK